MTAGALTIMPTLIARMGLCWHVCPLIPCQPLNILQVIHFFSTKFLVASPYPYTGRMECVPLRIPPADLVNLAFLHLSARSLYLVWTGITNLGVEEISSILFSHMDVHDATEKGLVTAFSIIIETPVL